MYWQKTWFKKTKTEWTKFGKVSLISIKPNHNKELLKFKRCGTVKWNSNNRLKHYRWWFQPWCVYNQVSKAMRYAVHVSTWMAPIPCRAAYRVKSSWQTNTLPWSTIGRRECSGRKISMWVRKGLKRRGIPNAFDTWQKQQSLLESPVSNRQRAFFVHLSSSLNAWQEHVAHMSLLFRIGNASQKYVHAQRARTSIQKQNQQRLKIRFGSLDGKASGWSPEEKDSSAFRTTAIEVRFNPSTPFAQQNDADGPAPSEVS